LCGLKLLAPIGENALQINLINLDRDAERLREFQQRNPHIRDIIRFAAVEGRLLDKARLVEQGLITPDLNYTQGSLGSAFSHIINWRTAVDQNKFMTIVEDDAIISHNFDVQAKRVLAQLPAEWDLILWGWNFDVPLFFDMLPGVSGASVSCNQEQMRQNIDQFQRLETSPVPVRLLHSFGTMCYSVSPKGAQALLNICLPLRAVLIDLPGFGWRAENKTIDAIMNVAYATIQSFVCIPPLAVAENRHETSRVVGGP
jgi:GR25 family glycosyltransferase involved in LPS biosynthesis